MTLQEYFDYAEGVRTREAKGQEPLRLIYWVLRASNSKKQLPYSEVIQQWPLYTDKNRRTTLPVEDMRNRWNNLKEAVKAYSHDKGGV